MESSTSALASLLLKNLLASIFVSLCPLHDYKIFHLLHSYLLSSFLFFLSLLPSFFSILPLKAAVSDGGSGVSRALSQLLLLMNDIPVSSRKYEVVRSLAEKLIDENLAGLREVNCSVLSAAFANSLTQLEAAMEHQGNGNGNRARRLLRAAWRYAKPGRSEGGRSAEKLAAELLWLAQKMADSGCAQQAVSKWASAVNLACLALSAEPRLQGSLVRVSAFLIREAREMGIEKKEDGRASEEHDIIIRIRETKMKMLMSWVPLLCRANNGTDAPILSMSERGELEQILEQVISTLEEVEEQEMVLSLWLHHFIYCSASDWPNLHKSYTQWYSAARARLIQQHA